MASLLRDSIFKWFILLTIAIVPLLSIAKKQVHNFEGKCEMCHLTFAEDKKIFVREIDFLCNDCHTDLGLSHPSGIKPSMSVPDKFSLDWNGRMTCATCHNVHGDSESLLRVDKTGKVFCYMCHKETMGKHAGADQPAHTKGPIYASGFEVVDSANPIDRLSIDCLSCHDSSLGRSADVQIGSGIWNHGYGTSHPIGVDYMKVYAQGGYNHPSRINPSIRFFNGKIGCGSCHNLFSKEKSYLALNNRGAALCLACHKK